MKANKLTKSEYDEYYNQIMELIYGQDFFEIEELAYRIISYHTPFEFRNIELTIRRLKNEQEFPDSERDRDRYEPVIDLLELIKDELEFL